jgi:hypothetical protein
VGETFRLDHQPSHRRAVALPQHPWNVETLNFDGHLPQESRRHPPGILGALPGVKPVENLPAAILQASGENSA